jgi:hypothetical protein
VDAGGLHHLPALRGREPAPEMESAEGEAERTGGTEARHGGMFAHAGDVPPLRLVVLALVIVIVLVIAARQPVVPLVLVVLVVVVV